MSNALTHFDAVSGSPRPLQIDSLFAYGRAGYSYTSGTSNELQQLVEEVNDQGSVINELVGAVEGKSSVSAVESVLGGTSFGGSVLGGVARAAESGFSWQSVLKDVFPLGGLISGIAGLFDSAPTPPPLDQYDAPPQLNFNAVLNADGTLSQGSSDQYGYTRASSPGLDLTDAEGGPYSPYQRASNGSLVAVPGDPVTRYSGSLSLPDLVRSQVAPSTPVAEPVPAPTVAPAISPISSGGSGAAPTNASLTASPSNPVPTFDQQWFNDHGSLIASAVRTQLLNFHPIVDAINNL
jgi:hypothetical protein